MLFSKWKRCQIETEITKNPKVSNFQSFNAIFVKFSTDFVDWNVEKSQQGTNLLSSSLFRRDSCAFQVEKYLKLVRNRQKTQNFKLSKFLCSFCQFFDRLRGWNVKNGHQRKTLLPSRHFRKVNCGFQVEKNLKLAPNSIKNSKFSNFQSFHAFVVKISKDFADWNVETGDQSKIVLSSSAL